MGYEPIPRVWVGVTDPWITEPKLQYEKSRPTTNMKDLCSFTGPVKLLKLNCKLLFGKNINRNKK